MLYAVPTALDQPSTFGFIVSKAVGNAVTRNLVKRRLREIAVQSLRAYPQGLSVVVRALPPAANANFGALSNDYRKTFAAATSKFRAALPAAEQGGPAE
ncbi:ribonuclease P protein component [Arthrobacter sp. VKM Ac-2550]|nr:ribonuclease P protein component [Arthrobacter sp. VKM Ac-2550]